MQTETLPLDPVSQVKRVTFGKAETEATILAECDRTSIRTGPDGQLIIELFRHNARDIAVESIKVVLCAEDRARVVEAGKVVR